MMGYERFENYWDNFGKFIYQFQPKSKTFIKETWKDLNKII